MTVTARLSLRPGAVALSAAARRFNRRAGPFLALALFFHALPGLLWTPAWLRPSDASSAVVATAMNVRWVTAPVQRAAPAAAVEASAQKALESSAESVPERRTAAVSLEPSSSHPRDPAPSSPLAAPASTRSLLVSADALPPSPTASPPAVSERRVASNTPPALEPAPAYRSSGQLDPGPQLLEDVEPSYPPEAGLKEGSVVLRLLIGEDGQVDRVDVVRATPPNLFDNAAATAFAKAKFSPGKFAGVAVKSQVTMEVSFTPINRGAAVAGRSY